MIIQVSIPNLPQFIFTSYSFRTIPKPSQVKLTHGKDGTGRDHIITNQTRSDLTKQDTKQNE